jgi:hypothetical protein
MFGYFASIYFFRGTWLFGGSCLKTGGLQKTGHSNKGLAGDLKESRSAFGVKLMLYLGIPFA